MGCGRYCCRGHCRQSGDEYGDVFVVSTVVALAAKPLFVLGVTQAKTSGSSWKEEISVGVVGFLDFILSLHSFTSLQIQTTRSFMKYHSIV